MNQLASNLLNLRLEKRYLITLEKSQREKLSQQKANFDWVSDIHEEAISFSFGCSELILQNLNYSQLVRRGEALTELTHNEEHYFECLWLLFQLNEKFRKEETHFLRRGRSHEREKLVNKDSRESVERRRESNVEVSKTRREALV